MHETGIHECSLKVEHEELVTCLNIPSPMSLAMPTRYFDSLETMRKLLINEAACFTEATSGIAMQAVAQWSICRNGITSASKNLRSFFIIEE